MLDIQIRPVATWPGKETKNPSRSQFKCGYKRTLQDLEGELQRAGAIMSSLVIEMWVEPRMIRLDGKLRADARVIKPGIILRFTRRTSQIKQRPDGSRYYVNQDVSYPCDAFDSWTDNLRAIALSMEALRRVERYGVFKYDEIISRLALPSAEGKVSTKESAAAFMAQHSGVNREEIMFSETARAAAFRKAAMALHPDRGGNTEDFQKLNEANKVLAAGA